VLQSNHATAPLIIGLPVFDDSQLIFLKRSSFGVANVVEIDCCSSERTLTAKCLTFEKESILKEPLSIQIEIS